MILDTIKRRWPEYLLEIMVIIVGITFSFILNEWRAAQERTNAEIVALNSIKDDLVADTTLLNDEVEQIRVFYNNMGYIIRLYQQETEPQPDSIIAALSSFSIYTTFSANTTGYEQLRQTGQLNLISNKKLLKEIVEFYTQQSTLLKEYSYIDRTMSLNNYIPYLVEESPLFFIDDPLKESNNGKQLFRELLEDRKFRNSIIVNRVFKNQIILQYRQYLEQARHLIESIKTELHALR